MSELAGLMATLRPLHVFAARERRQKGPAESLKFGPKVEAPADPPGGRVAYLERGSSCEFGGAKNVS